MFKEKVLWRGIGVLFLLPLLVLIFLTLGLRISKGGLSPTYKDAVLVSLVGWYLIVVPLIVRLASSRKKGGS